MTVDCSRNQRDFRHHRTGLNITSEELKLTRKPLKLIISTERIMKLFQSVILCLFAICATYADATKESQGGLRGGIIERLLGGCSKSYCDQICSFYKSRSACAYKIKCCAE